MVVIESNYYFIFSGFNNYGLISVVNENNGLCKIFVFVKFN